ncbi:MAG: hypothetical protein AB1374_04650 [Bacillota bacterium]
MCKNQRPEDGSFETKEKRLVKAKKSYQRMEKEIQPFLKRRRIRQFSTAGQWYDSASLFTESE